MFGLTIITLLCPQLIRNDRQNVNMNGKDGGES